jgi:acyl-CoA synthetase (AMP-forming)/AMP-acid ligase II
MENLREQIDALDAAWSQRRSFVIDASGIAFAPTSDVLSLLPEHLMEDHFVLMTSGSTGLPRAIVGSKQRAEQLARLLTDVQDSTDVSEAILALPLHYSFALVNQWVWTRVERRRLEVTAGFSAPDDLRATLQSSDNAMLCLVGIHVPLLERFFTGQRFPGVIRLHFAGGRFPQEALGKLRDFFPNAVVYNNYGCAEAMPRLTVRLADAADDAANIGRPLPGIELATTDEGALVFQSPYAAVGFVESGRWSPVAADAWIPTGDLGEQLPSGDWRLTGRASEVFKRHGEKVSIPAVLAGIHESWTGQASCYRTTDRNGEDGYVLVVAPKPSPADVRGMLGVLRSHARAMWPLRIESRDTLPVLLNGKVDVRSLEDVANDVHWHQRI